ncbi:MAG: OmpA family protein, partial [Maribacter sp.]|nr:OmpA family protein [Maribacter sp.]
AIEILSEPIDSSNSKRNLREWSVDVINQYSGVKLDTSASRDLIEKSALIGLESFSGLLKSESPCEFESKGIIFSFDKMDITPDTAAELEPFIQGMMVNPEIKIRIETHTDSRGSSEYNLEMSQRRSNSLRDYFISRGISAARIVAAIGMGEMRACMSDQDIAALPTRQEREVAHAKNRRTRIIIEGCEDLQDCVD